MVWSIVKGVLRRNIITQVSKQCNDLTAILYDQLYYLLGWTRVFTQIPGVSTTAILFT